MRSNRLVIIAASLLAACSSHQSSPLVATPGGVSPYLVQQQGSGPWYSFPANHQTGNGNDIAAGHDGAMWYCDSMIYRFGMDGSSTQETPNGWGYNCGRITPNPDGNLYFTYQNNSDNSGGIGKITTDGVVSIFIVYPGTGNPPPADAIVTGSDGNVWDIDGPNGITRLTPEGVVTSFQQPWSMPQTPPSLVRGPDKNLWASVDSGIYRVAIADGSTAQYTTTKSFGLAAANDGGLWFSEGRQFGRLDPGTGTVTTFPVKQDVEPMDMVQGLHEILYFTDRRHPDTIGRFSIPKHKLLAGLQLVGASFTRLTIGPDGNVWATEDFSRNQIDVYALDFMTTTPSSMTLTQSQQQTLTATEKNDSKPLQATTSNPAVATEMPAGTNQWTITAEGSGTCTITVSDGRGNSIDVDVTVN